MTLTHHERVGKALGLLREGLRPFVEREFKAQFGKAWDSAIQDVLADTRFRGGKGDATYDVAALLVIMDRTWRDVFQPTLGRAARSLVNELIDIRNRWAHQEAFPLDDADRAIDSVARLLKAISAAEADRVEAMKTELLRLRLDEIAGRDSRPPVEAISEPATEAEPKREPRVFVSSTSSMPGKSDERAAVSRDVGQTDRIRRFVLDKYISTARAAGEAEVTIRAGDVHKAMGLKNAMPTVCNAIGSHRFSHFASVRLLERSGPANGSNARFRFSFKGQTAHAEPQTTNANTRRYLERPGQSINLSDALVLVSCVKSKLPHAAPARELYTSPWFRKVRDLVAASGARWFLLSSQYGLVAPDEVIAPYEFTLYTLGVAEREAWAAKVLEKLLPLTNGYKRVVFIAIARYCEFLVEPLRRRGLTVETPLEHLRRGEQLAWLSEYE